MSWRREEVLRNPGVGEPAIFRVQQNAVKTTVQTLARFHRKIREIVASELGENTRCESG